IKIYINKGEIVTLLGANGAGKSTLIKAIFNMLPCIAGKISFNNNILNSLPTHKIITTGCVLVPEKKALFTTLNVKDNLLLGGYIINTFKNRKLLQQRLTYVYRLFPMLKQRSKQPAGTLSGGEQQMLLLARALITKPQLLILDEPAAGLAPRITAEIFTMLQKLQANGKTILLIEQNAAAALKIADRGYIIETGKINYTDTAANLLKNNYLHQAYLGRS
ncbi:MAG TPA: ABC transporter ATP-binding protein, partial [Spirochaetota bacterium]|nr:ABC transporter ATP-binding protein [Spirochaetota bacterium]